MKLNLLTPAAPEDVGIPSRVISSLIADLKEKGIPMHSLLLWRRGKLIAEGYYAPCRKDELHRMFSVTKSFVSAAVGVLCDRGRCSLDDPIIRYFPEYLPRQVHPWLAQTTIRDMLMMRSCHAATTYKIHPETNWVQSFFTVPPTHKPGTVFHYDTSSAHTLCALVEKLTGKKLLDFLREVCLDDIGFSKEAYIIEDPFGTSTGGSGLMATPRDLLRFAILVMNNGNLNGTQYLPAWYLREACSCLTPNCVTGPIPEECLGYGYQFWRGRHGSVICYGMGGQLAVMMPQHELICVTTADTQGCGGGNQVIYDALFDHLLPLPENGPIRPTRSWQEALSKTLQTLQIEPLAPSDSIPFPDGYGPLRGPRQAEIDELRYRILPADAFSADAAAALDSSAPGFHSVSFSFSHQEGVFSYRYQGTDCRMVFGIGRMAESRLPIYGYKYAASGLWLSPDCLYIRVHLLDTCVGSLHIQAYFGDNDVTIFLRKQEESLFKEFNGHLYGIR